MGLFTRFVKMFKADMHGVMDQLEDKHLLLKQHLREMEESLLRKHSRLKSIIDARQNTLAEKKTYEKEEEKLDAEITRAIEKEKDDVARLLIRKLKRINKLGEKLEKNTRLFDSDITSLQKCIEKQQLEYDHLKLKADEYFHMADMRNREDGFSKEMACHFFSDISEEEIDFELTLRKETAKGRI